MDKVQLVIGLLFGVFLWGEISAQETNQTIHSGMPYFKVFTPADYPGEQQNRWITQWNDGSMLIANSGGMLQHADSKWRIFGAEDISFISSLKRSKIDSSKIWSGSFSNIGYFQRSDSALFVYKSLTALLPDSLRDFSNITAIEEFNGRVFFLNDLYLFQYHPETQKAGLAEAVYEFMDNQSFRITHISVWQNALFVFGNDGRVLKLNSNGEPEWIGSSPEEDMLGVTASVAWQQSLLITDRNRGLVQFDGVSFQEFETSVNAYLIEHVPSDIAIFRNGSIAVSTDDGGTVVIDQNGSFEYLLASKTGLVENIHNSLYIDHNEDLWISGNESITKVHTGVPVRHISGEIFGFGDALQITHFRDQFYIGSIDGLYVQEYPFQQMLDASPLDVFTQISPSPSPYWDFQVVEGELWTAGNSGIYRIDGRELTRLFNIETYFLRPFGEDKILVVTSNGVELLAMQNGQWKHEGTLDVAAFYVYSLVVTNEHTFWAGGVQGQLVKVTYDAKTNRFSQKKYEREDGLLPSDSYEPTLQNGELIINSNSGFMKYDVQSDRLIKYDVLNDELGGWGEYLSVDEAGNYWVNYITSDYRGIIQLEKTSRNEWEKRDTEFEISPDHFGDFIEINGPHLWVGSTESVMYRDLNVQFDRSAPEVYIWQIQSLFDQQLLSHSGQVKEIPYDQRNIGITLASTSYRFPEKNEFRYKKVDGGEWSGWRAEPEVSVNSFFPGTYSLTVQTKNFVQQVSAPVSYAITIAAPWYLSNLAYGLYLIVIIGGLVFSVRTLSNYRVRREMEQLKLQEAERLFELDAMKDRLFANISHEFRTPLTISHGLVKKALQQFSDDENHEIKKRDLLVMNRNMIRLKDMVDQIIDLTKSDQNHLKLKQKYYPAEKLTSLSVESFRSLAEFHGHQFEFIDETKDAILFADRSKVEIMINNLISNAIKFTPNGGKIIIKAEVKDDQFVLTISDTGPGIPAGDEEAIFERFHRIERSEEDYVEGMGVGLELSRTLARLHSGDIVAQPDVAQGATFMLSLPVAKIEDTTPVIMLEDFEHEAPPLVEDRTEKSKLERLERITRRILLVEDNADMRSYVEGILADLGEVTTANDGEEALSVIGDLRPDLIITDLMMPNMDGKSLIEKLAAHDLWKEIPVIVLTAKSLEQDKTELLRIGVVDYITKPFEPEQLMLKSRNLLTYYKRRLSAMSEASDNEEETLTQQLISYIREHFSDSNLTVDRLVGEFPQSRRSLYRNIQKETGMTPSELIREVRLTAARDLVNRNEKDYRLAELADAVGYKSASSFRKAYETRFGVHPLG
ncbi:response regulator [Gracilimonas mengyeensis]|uniref:histidine kinase n=1 Tax=Gracilimonas mengyeensis TaxID=1302730 RepID=A0A521BVA0_9BACT|nr:response regulator [Gracilimonas mengyeensis]SMO51086.1 His Kinase A (phospho-acceptor) domain-containing protein [Gracilimonas mengyeensis]